MENTIKKHTKKLFYSAFFLYLVATVLQSTMFTQYSVLSKIFVLMRYVSFGVAVIKILLEFYYEWMCDEAHGRKAFSAPIIKRMIVYIIMFAIVGIVSICTGDRTLLFVVALLVASRGIEFDEIAEKSFWVQFSLMMLVVICSTFNVIPDLLFKRETIPIRHALGYTYPSVMVTSCFFIFLLYLWNRNSYLSDKEFLVTEIFNLLIYILTDSRTGFVVLGVVSLILWGAGKKVIHRNLKALGNRMKGIWMKIIRHTYDYLTVYLAAVLLLLCATISWKVTQIIDNLLTYRISLAESAIRNYGIHLFGNNIEWIGYGGSTDTDSIQAVYNFVDSSYGYMLVNYGLLVFVITLLLFVITSKFVRKTQSKIRAFIFGMVILYCFIEPRLLEIQVNNFLFLIVPAVAAGVKACKNYHSNLLKKAGR